MLFKKFLGGEMVFKKNQTKEFVNLKLAFTEK
jgi:hypothetical protein